MSQAGSQMREHVFPPEGAFSLIPSSGTDPCRSIIRAFAECDVRVIRNVIISTPDSPGDLSAQAGDFWFHTDGVFLELPPRWVVIQVLEADEGGALHVLNSDGLGGSLPKGEILFGRPARGVTAPLVTAVGGWQIFRYRQDYMHQLPGGANLEAAHQAVRLHAARSSIALGPLPPDQCLVLDNWQVMHRREDFKGRRVIRRVWLG